MAQNTVPTPTAQVNTPSTYRLAGSCSVRAYVACDDTPYHLETPVTVTMPNPAPNHTPERAATVRTLVRELGASKWLKVSGTVLAHLEANPDATVAELINLLNQ